MEFYPFLNLPIELRLKVWALTLEPRLIDVMSQRIPPIPAILQIDRETRAEFLKVYQFHVFRKPRLAVGMEGYDKQTPDAGDGLYFNPNLDTLSFTRSPKRPCRESWYYMYIIIRNGPQLDVSNNMEATLERYPTLWPEVKNMSFEFHGLQSMNDMEWMIFTMHLGGTRLERCTVLEHPLRVLQGRGIRRHTGEKYPFVGDYVEYQLRHHINQLVKGWGGNVYQGCGWEKLKIEFIRPSRTTTP